MDYRLPTDGEIRVVKRLLGRSFPGASELLKQLDTMLVRNIDADGSLQIVVQDNMPMALTSSVPTNGRYFDSDARDEGGPAVNVLLHVKNGRLCELEVYKDDASKILISPYDMDTSRIEVY